MCQPVDDPFRRCYRLVMAFSRHFLAVDIGTSSLKAAILSEEGTVLAQVRRPLLRNGENLSNWKAQWWHRTFREAIPHILGDFRIDAVVLSGNGPTIVAIDKEGRAIDPVLLWLDGRSSPLTGGTSFYLPKTAWLRQNRPEVMERVGTFLTFPEYLAYWLTGVAVTCSPNEAFNKYIWTDESLRAYDLPKDLFPDIVPLGTVMGTVRKERSEETGLSSGIPVVIGGPDYLMSLVGTDTLEPGLTCDRAGTSEGINHVVSERLDAPGLRLLPHIVPGMYSLAGILSSTGLLFEWFRSVSGQKGRDYGDMMLDIVREEEDSDIPWFFPTVHDGAAWEFRSGMFIGLGSQHNRAAMGRAVVLSIGFAVRKAVEILGSIGAEVRELRACGGQAKNGIWNQMKADIVGTPIRVPAVEDAELVGNLCAGLVALGDHDDLRSAAAATVTFTQVYEPRRDRYRRYTIQYRAYQERYTRFRQALSECI